MENTALQVALERLAEADILLVQGKYTQATAKPLPSFTMCSPAAPFERLVALRLILVCRSRTILPDTSEPPAARPIA